MTNTTARHVRHITAIPCSTPLVNRFDDTRLYLIVSQRVQRVERHTKYVDSGHVFTGYLPCYVGKICGQRQLDHIVTYSRKILGHRAAS